MAKTRWVSVTPGDYDLENIATSVERAVSLEVENGLRVQVLRIKSARLAEPTIKDALEQTGSARALVWATERYVYAAIFHEE